MFKNYLKIGLRNIKKNKVYSFINIIGLSIGLTCCLLIMIWIQYELSFDKFHTNYDNLYRITSQYQRANSLSEGTLTHQALGAELKNSFPEIVRFSRFRDWNHYRAEANNKIGEKTVIGLVDRDFLEMFSFPLTSGDPSNALTDKYSVVMTEETAEYFYGDKDPIGETFLFTDKIVPFTVTGIAADIPANSHIQFDVLMPVQVMEDWNVDLNGWGNNYTWGLYVETKPGADKDVLESKMSVLLNTYDMGSIKNINLQPLKDVHLRSIHLTDTTNYFEARMKDIYTFLAVAVVVFLIACFNFVCLSTARSSKREKEVGVRKISGAARVDLVKQFMGESFILVGISLALALNLVALCIPVLNQISGKEINFSLLDKGTLFLSVCLVGVFTGIFSGSYPALYLSSLKPANLFKSLHKTGKTSGLNMRKSLVIFQYVFTIALLFISLIFFKQLRFVNSMNMGFDKDNIVITYMDMNNNFGAIKNELLQNGNILNVSTGFAPAMGDRGHATNAVEWEGKTENVKLEFNWIPSYYGYAETFNMDIVRGRFFSEDFPTDKSGYVLNETAVKDMGIEDPIGKRFSFNGKNGQIIGVVKDFHFSSARVKIKPAFFLFRPEFGEMCIKISPENQAAAVAHIQSVWETFTPEKPFEYTFFVDMLRNRYKNEEKMGFVIRYFTLLVIVVFFLGLFGLIGYISEQRTKEIGIRKVLGATTSSITMLIFKDFFKVLLYACFVAFPLGFILSSSWLKNFVYKIDLNIWAFTIIFGFVALLTLFIIGFQTLKVSRMNPVDTLRFE